MVHGLFSEKRSSLLIPITFLMVWLGFSMNCPLRAKQPEAKQPEAKQPETKQPEAKEVTSQIPTGFDLIEAYGGKIDRLEKFLKDHRLQESELQPRKSRAADEVNRIIGGLESLMEREAERIFEQAMKSPNPIPVLRKLKESHLHLQNIARRAENELKRRTVGGQTYPTIEEAQEQQRKLKEEDLKREAETEKQDLEEVKKLKQELLTDRISQAAQAFAEEDAREMLETAMRLVLPQRREHLQEILRKHPTTKNAAEAAAILEAIHHQGEIIAGRKLQEALEGPVIHDQRWRRLKEIERDHPRTPAAAEAQKLFQQHLTQVPPVGITNRTAHEVELTVDRPYSLLEETKLLPGERRTFPTAFPLMVRVKIDENEWTVYRAWAESNYSLESAQNNIPVLRHSP
jgi:hypothetical protein